MDLFNLLGKLGDFKEQYKTAKEHLKTVEIQESHENLVTVRVTASMEIKEIKLSDHFVKEHSVEDINKVVTETVANAIAKAKVRMKEEMSEAVEGTIPNLPGFELKNLLFY